MSPLSLRRRRGRVRVRVVGVIVIIFGVDAGIVLVLLLLLRVLLGAPQRTIIRRPLVIRGDVLHIGWVGWQVVLARRRAAWKLNGAV
jgi:hypothetical protein